MSDSLEGLRQERDRYVRRYARERDARAQAESIGERAMRELTSRNRELKTHFEQVLRDREARYRGIFESAVDAIIAINEKGVIEDVNFSTETLFGYQSAELLGHNVSMLMPAVYARQHDQFLRRYIETGNRRVIGIGREVVGLRKDGSTFPAELSVGEVWLGERRSFTGIVRDITLRKEAERRLEEMLEDLKHSHDALLATLNSMNVGSVLVDGMGCITFVSVAAVAAPIMDLAQAIGAPWEEAVALDHKYIEAMRRLMAIPASSRDPLEIDWEDSGGKRCHSRVEIKDDPREANAFLMFFYDLTELNHLRNLTVKVSQGQMVGSGEAMQTVYERIQRVAAGDWTVLIEGETGVGKELAARAIHASSSRRRGPFIAVNCAGMTDSLLESQLFGHRKGAFTDAVAERKGFFEAASGGTILLDEIGDISSKLQKALLRVIQEREVMRLGDNQVRKVDVRILAATNRDIDEEVAAGHFRQDLLYRVREGRLTVPPLQERVEDIPSLVANFLAEQRMSAGKPIFDLELAALRALEKYHWPGNVRELRSAISFAVIACHSPSIALTDLPPEIIDSEADPSVRSDHELASPPSRAPTRRAANTDERSQILAALDWAEDNRARAARKLGIGRATLYRRMRAHGIPVRKRAPTAPRRIQ